MGVGEKNLMKSSNKIIIPLVLLIGFTAFPVLGQEAEDDGDGIDLIFDNCPTISNTNQADRDGDNVGDLCDIDRDGDGLVNAFEEQIHLTNPDSWDSDGDKVSDLFDCKPSDSSISLGTSCDEVVSGTVAVSGSASESPGPQDDSDSDGIVNEDDNCPFTFNPEQTDSDEDGIGDDCDNLAAVSGENQTVINGVVGGSEGGCNLVEKSFRSSSLWILLIPLLLLFQGRRLDRE